MPDDPHRRYLWRLLDQHRGDFSFEDLPSVAEGLEGIGESLDYDDLAYISQRLNRHSGGAFTPPSHLCRFVAELLASREALSVLDPVAGEGWLPARVSALGRATNVIAVTDNGLAPWLSEKLGLDRLTIVRNEPSTTFDAIVSMPPVFGGHREHRQTPDGNRDIHDEPGLLRMLDVAELLAEGGLIAWIVPPRFAFNNSQRSVRRTLRHFGLHLSGLLQIPPGTFAPTTPMGFELALIERTQHDDLFVAALPEASDAQDELIGRLRDRTEGPEPSQGRLVTEKAFFGLGALEAVERARRLSERRGLNAVPCSQVIAEINRPRRRGRDFQRFEDHPDAVYLPEMARIDATTDQDTLPERLQSYLQLVVRRDYVHPAYLAGLLNTPLGHAIREAASSGSTMPRITRDRLLETTLYLPPLRDQERAVEVIDSIRLMRVELDELEGQLWDRPRRVSDIAERVSRVNHEDRFQDWVESLPFPLASILRTYHAVDRGPKDKYERLLHFFEALAAFVATVHLSAFRADSTLWLSFRERAASLFEEHNFSWTHPSFGMWRAVIDSAAPIARELLNGGEEPKTRVMTLYETADPKPVEFLVARPLLTLLQKTNLYRNRWAGHGGAVSEAEATDRHREIAEDLNTFRSLCGAVFQQYQTIEPREPTILPGPVFRCPARLVTGSNPQFEHTSIKLLSPPVTGGLYLHNPGHTRALELLSLVQIRQAPQPVCYFYNRLDSSGAHLVSYHFGEQSDVTDSTGGLAPLITDLSSPPA